MSSLPSFKEGSFLFEELWEAPIAHLASQLLKEGRSILIVTGGVREDRLFSDLSYFHKGLLEFPAWETLPGEEIPPSPDILGKRFQALHTLIHKKDPSIVLCPLQSLLQKVVSKEEISSLLTKWQIGDKIPFSTLEQFLNNLGYTRAPIVSDKGEFALRGGILDIFPLNSPTPLRVEFFDDQIELIKPFDPISQKTTGKETSLFLTPAKEFPLLQKAKHLSSILDYLGENPFILWDDLVQIEDNYISLKNMPGAKSIYFYPLDELLNNHKKMQHIFCAPQKIEELSEVTGSHFEWLGKTFSAKKVEHPYLPIQPLQNLLDDPGIEFLFLSEHEIETKEIEEKIGKIPKKSRFEKGNLTSGFLIGTFAIVPYSEISGRSSIRRQKWRTSTHAPASHFHLLTPGDYVVHFHSGIAKYLGVEKQTDHLGKLTEFLILEYAEQSKLFVPISQAHLVSRYIGTKEETPSLSQLGSKRWQTTRLRAQKEIVGYANELLQLYAAREAKGGFVFSPDSTLMRQFEEDFPYTPTDDQLLAINAIKEDMMSSKAMDRLICGDVGYGKTEVAMRAAFKAVADGKKQVAVLVPTTVLAMQHFETFSARMAPFPVKVAVISRFQSQKEAKIILEDLASGKIDILVGTHRLLSKDLKFHDLGLLIIDEEQRFGVRSKEHLKKMKEGIDCLTLSATPIPRTLYMSLVHARDMSIINTPPHDRLPVKTIIAEHDSDVIQNSLMREFARGGQAYFIHNRVESIYTIADQIQKLVPTAKKGIVHGQMDADDIDLLFHDFKMGNTHLLFATTIIENGIDIPNANTILIDKADTYGLADLYQLKGRVGRWNRAAYAYFLIPKGKKLSDIAKKRLNALVEAQGFGGGMKIAMRDLEIRGAGNLLGTDQSGEVSAIGFNLYCKLLKKAVDALKAHIPITFLETKMEFSFEAYIPEKYINEFSLRMEMYHRFGEASTSEELEEIFKEISDRFGKPLQPIVWLYHLSRIRVFSSLHHFTLLKFEKMTFLAERQQGNDLIKKTLMLPKFPFNPETLEKHVIENLKKSFF